MDQKSQSDVVRESRLRMIRGFGIDGMVVTIPNLSKVIGTPRSTLYARISKGSFFLPIRELHGSPVVLVDDLLDWMQGGELGELPNSAPVAAEATSERARQSVRDRAIGAVGDAKRRRSNQP